MAAKMKSMWRPASAPIVVGVLLVLIGFASFSTAAEAPNPDQRVVTTMTAKQLKTVLGEQGYLGVKISDKGHVEFHVEGVPVTLFIAKDHTSIMTYAGWTGTNADLNKVNEWNKNNNYSRAYIDDEGDPIIELDLVFKGGVTIAHVKDFLSTVKLSVNKFASFLSQ